MEVPVYNMQGEEVSRAQLADSVFAVPANRPVMHQALVRQLANARVGTAAVKTRGMVHGSTKKMYRQKGTGRARHGGTRAPQFRGGGIVFGPQPRSYEQAMPRKMRRLALRSALSVKLSESRLVVLDDLSMEEPRTREMVALLDRLGVQAPALIVLPAVDLNVVKSARNIPRVKTLPSNTLNIVDVLSHDYLVMPLEAVRQVERVLAPAPGAAEEQPAVESAAPEPEQAADEGTGEE